MLTKPTKKLPIPGRPLSRARAAHWLAQFPDDVGKAEHRFAQRTYWHLVPDIDDELKGLMAVRDGLMQHDGPEPVWNALSKLGLESLWVVNTEELDPDALAYSDFQKQHNLLVEVRSLVRQRIGRWVKAGRSAGTRSERAKAASYLLKVGAKLAPDLRGQRREVIVDPYKLRYEYAQVLFRLWRFLIAFDDIKRRRKTKNEVFALAHGCGLPIPMLEAHFSFDDEGLLIGKMLPRAELAAVRDYIAEKYGLSSGTISTILSRVKRGGLRK